MPRALARKLFSPIPPLPRGIRPMLATPAADIPSDQSHYAFEFKWDGVRAIWYSDGRTAWIESRNQLPIAHRYPELRPLQSALSSRSAILDGEIVAMDAAGRPSFALLQRRMHVEDPSVIHRLSAGLPVCYLLFDLLYLDGRSTMDLPWTERRSLLEGLHLKGARWETPSATIGAGSDMLAVAREQRLEGVVAKRISGRYEPGQRSGSWLKIKVVGRQEFVIGGWVPEGGTNRRRIGSLLVGYYEAGKLRYAGGVGTGFDSRWHEILTKLLATIQRPTSPFADRVPRRDVIYVDPLLVAEVEYRRWTPEGILQQAAFKGLREDKSPTDVKRETEVEPQITTEEK